MIMKHVDTMKSIRNRDFMLACRRVIESSSEPLSQKEVAIRAAGMVAPEFYVSFGYALRRLKEMESGGRATFRRQSAAEMFWELRKRVRRLMRRHGLQQADALARVLARGNAPSFYLSPSAARCLLCKLIQEARVKRRRHRHIPITTPSSPIP